MCHKRRDFNSYFNSQEHILMRYHSIFGTERACFRKKNE